MTAISWLHLSDLHRGMTTQKWLWANIEAEFFTDLGRLHDRCGPWDMILFTGDLTLKGTKDEFGKLNDTLGRLYERLRQLGSKPHLLTVPGNHDLKRPSANDPAVKLLKEWNKHSDVRDEFWSVSKSPYRLIVQDAFAEYETWRRHHQFPRPSDLKIGLLPGDFSATVQKENIRVGIVGLNIAFLQLAEGNFEKKLAVHPLQLSEVCGEHYDDWFEAHDINLLMTHQPPSWLNSESGKAFESEINKPGRFLAHLYGHMHANRTYSIVIGGALPKRSWQVASVFGLEEYGIKKQVRRQHGYTAGRVQVQGELGRLELWPRRGEQHQAGHWQIVPDASSTLTDAFSLPVEEIKFSARSGTKPIQRTGTTAPFRVLLLSTDKDLSEARDAIAEHLRRALGVDVSKGSASTPDIDDYDLVILLQGWWWENGTAVRAWGEASQTRRIVFLVDEDSDWPPRRITELTAGSDIEKFRRGLSSPNYFAHPDELPESIGTLVTTVLQRRVGDEGLGLQSWERAYLSFRLPAWTVGRTAISSGHLLEAENAEELYQADLYVALDGFSRNWQRDTQGRPKRIRKKRKKHAGPITTQEIEKRVRLGRWLSVSELRRIALVGAPGGGKTIFLTRTAAALANACLGRPTEFEPDIDMNCLRHRTGMLPFPVVLEATRIAKYESSDMAALMEAIADELSSTGSPRPPCSEIHQGLKAGRYLLLIDALDEIADTARRSQVLNILKGMAASAVFPLTRLVLTTRSARYTGSLKFGPELETVEVAPLDDKQIRELCDNWSRHRGRDSEYSESLMSAVSGLTEQVGVSSEDQAITENPLMLTAICMVFERYRSLPDDRGRLCELLIDDLCRSRNSEDQTRGWKLDDATKKDLLQRIALAMQQQGEQAWPVTRAIELATTLVPTDEKFVQLRAKKYLDWAADHTGLLRFQQDSNGEEQIRFWHRLFREYLSANRLAQLDLTAVDLADQLWQEKRLENPFWEDVIRLLPRALGTIEKARSLREQLERLAHQSPSQRGRLLGLAIAGIIENRDLYPEIKFNEKAMDLAAIYESEGLEWLLKDRLLFLEGLGRLDPQGGDPRIFKERWIEIPRGSIRTKSGDELERRIRSSAKPLDGFSIAWVPVSVQEFEQFLQASDFENPKFWSTIPTLNYPKADDSAKYRFHYEPLSLESRIKTQLRHPNYPVGDITLQEAVAFCRWRTEHRPDRRITRLLTEMEWLRVKDYLKRSFRADSSYREDLLTLGFRAPVGAISLRTPKPIEFPSSIWQWCFPAHPRRSSRSVSVFGSPFAARHADDSFGRIAYPPPLPEFRELRVGMRCGLFDPQT